MRQTADVLVVGCGLAGLTTALAAADQGCRVTVIGTPLPGAASRCSAGLLAPSLAGLPSRVLSVALEARDSYPRFVSALRERTGIEIPLDRRGVIELGDPETLANAIARMPSSSRLDAQELASAEPALAHHVGGAVLHPNDGSVDTEALMWALEKGVERSARIDRVLASVIALDFGQDTTSVTTSGGDRVLGHWTVLAAGAWSAHLRGLPRTLPVRPLRGQLLRLDKSPLRHVCSGAGGYLVPRGDSLLVGATSEDVGFQMGTSSNGRRFLRSVAEDITPELSHAAVLDHWSAFRPMTPDGLPIVGPDSRFHHLVYACGYSRNGILMAPWAARQIANVISGVGGPMDFENFAIDRFAYP